MGNNIHSIRERARRMFSGKTSPALPSLELHRDFPARWKAASLFASAFILWTLLTPGTTAAQTASAPQASHEARKPAGASGAKHKYRRDLRRPAARIQSATAKAQAAPPAPPKPNWPIDQPPTPARVTWDSRGLSIEASNSSLDQILQEVTTDTGVKLQGQHRDERIFGDYGPGPAREVLADLLDGLGYNVLMIGGAGDAPPQQIIFTAIAPSGHQPANAGRRANVDESSDAGDQPQPLAQPDQPMPMRNPFGLGAQRVPLEMQQDVQIRRREMEEQRGQEQQNEQNSPQ